jgi:hypothetical protein
MKIDKMDQNKTILPTVWSKLAPQHLGHDALGQGQLESSLLRGEMLCLG